MAITGGHKTARKATGGPVAVSSTTWASLDDTTFDLTIAAATGDMVEVSVEGTVRPGREDLLLDAVTLNGTTQVNRFGGARGSKRVAGLQDLPQRGGNVPVNFVTRRVLVAGDIFTASVKVRIVAKGTGRLEASADDPIVVTVTNFGAPAA
jgi:hypothetical protein